MGKQLTELIILVFCLHLLVIALSFGIYSVGKILRDSLRNAPDVSRHSMPYKCLEQWAEHIQYSC